MKTSALRIADAASGAAAIVVPELGFNCISFEVPLAGETIQAIDSPADVLQGNARPSGFGIPILFPFPNRIRGGKYEWDGHLYSVPVSPGKPDAIHGFCYDRPWRVVDQQADSLTGQFQLSRDDPDRAPCWPADFLFEVRYRVTGSRLECQFRITNPDTRPLPWGLGTHAYFKVPFAASSQPKDCIFSVPVTEEWELQDYLPTGRRLPLDSRTDLTAGIRFGSRSIDNVFTGWKSEKGTVRSSIIDEPGGIELLQACDARYFRDAVVYTPPGRNSLCIEPYTCVTDAINLSQHDPRAGLRVLNPGGTVQTWIALQVGPVLT